MFDFISKPQKFNSLINNILDSFLYIYISHSSSLSSSKPTTCKTQNQRERSREMEQTFLMIKPDGVQRGLVRSFVLFFFFFIYMFFDLLKHNYLFDIEMSYSILTITRRLECIKMRVKFLSPTFYKYMVITLDNFKFEFKKKGGRFRAHVPRVYHHVKRPLVQNFRYIKHFLFAPFGLCIQF